MAPGALCALRQRAAAAPRQEQPSPCRAAVLRQRALFLLALCALAACTTAERRASPFGAPVHEAGADAASGTHFSREHDDEVGSLGDQLAPRRRLTAVAAPQPTSGWCGAPPSNTFGATLGAPGSCLGDVAVAAVAATPQCTATDVNFTIPDLHFHQVCYPLRRFSLLSRAQFTSTRGSYAGWNLFRTRQLRQGIC